MSRQLGEVVFGNYGLSLAGDTDMRVKENAAGEQSACS